MRRHLVDRRDFLASAGAGFTAMLAPRGALALSRADAVFTSPFKAPDGSYGVATLSEAGEIVDTYVLPQRGHDVVAHSRSGRCAAFARRPGTTGVAFNARADEAPLVFSTPPGRHFYGHGAYSVDGRLLYASENDYEAARGVIGVYDATGGYRRIGEMPTHGLGPHELILMPGGKTIAVANGGIETHPDYGRTVLNHGSMRPSITLVDAATGDLIAKHVLPASMSQLSTRHVDVDADGRLWFGCQYHGEVGDVVPLIGYAGRDDALEWLDLRPEVGAALANYVGAIVVNRKSGMIGVTSPNGNAAVEFSAENPGRMTIRHMEKVSGIAADGAGFAYSSMAGSFAGRPTPELWDNHIRLL